MNIDLLVELRPGSVPDRKGTRTPAIERCFARGEKQPTTDLTYFTGLLRDFGLSDADAPMAAIALAGEGDDPGTHYWLRADPVSLRPTLHRVAGGTLPPGDLDWSEARARADILAQHLREEGCDLVLKHPQRWYLRCETPQRLRTTPPPGEGALLDESLLPGGPDGARWQRLMTEAQMLLHAAEVDLAREAAGRSPANGIWIWGGGTAPDGLAPLYTRVYSDDVVPLGLARLSGARAVPLPASAAGIANAPDGLPDHRLLIAISQATSLDLPTLDALWVAPLLEQIARGDTKVLRLRVIDDVRTRGCVVTRSLLRRWWRRALPLADHA